MSRRGTTGVRPRPCLNEPWLRGDAAFGEACGHLVVERAVCVDERPRSLARALEQLAILAQARELQIAEARLSRPEQLPLAADLEILLRELEAVRRRDERFEPLDRRVGQLVARARDQQAIRL